MFLQSFYHRTALVGCFVFKTKHQNGAGLWLLDVTDELKHARTRFLVFFLTIFCGFFGEF